MKSFLAVVVAVLSILLISCGSGASSSSANTPATPDPGPDIEQIVCTFTTCSRLVVVNDPPAETGGVPDFFRGYGDPSLELDADTGTLWLSYSWLNLFDIDPGIGVNSYGGVRTHLARSDDGGNNFQFVRAINEPMLENQPTTGADGWTRNEVSTLVKEPGGQWQMLWLRVLDLLDGTKDGLVYWRSTAPTPGDLGNDSEVWLRGAGVAEGYNAPVNLSELSELSNCVTYTEPALFVAAGSVYLLSNCVLTLPDGSRNVANERLVLVRQQGNGYVFVGTITDAMDAADLGGSRLEQADIALARDGTVLLIVSPLVNDTGTLSDGCVILEFTNFASAELLRDSNGVLIPRGAVTVSEPNTRSGACTYDAASDTGLLVVTVETDPTTQETEYSILETDYHP